MRENNSVSDQAPPPSDDATDRDRVPVRRAPRIGAFLVVGGFLGFLVTLILTSLFEAGPTVGFTTLVAYFSLYGISGGVLLGALAAIIVDRRSRRRLRMIEVEREIVEAEQSLEVEAETTSRSDSDENDGRTA